MKTPEQLKQWVRSGGKKCVTIRQWSTPEQEEFMRDSPSKREFDRLHEMLVFCKSAKEIEHIEKIACMHNSIDGIPSGIHLRAILDLAGQYKRKLKERRTIKYWWRNANNKERFAASLLSVTLACLILFVIR